MIKESFLISCIRRSREYGEGVGLANQDLKSLKDVVKSNVYTTICLSQSGYVDIKEVIKIMGLDPEQADMLLRMQVGEAIIRKAGGFSYSQLIKSPFIKPKNISNRQIDKINENDPVIQSLLSKVVKRVEPETEGVKIQSGIQDQPKIELSNNEKKLIDTIFYLQNNKKFPKIEIYEISKLKQSTASKTLKGLVEKGLVKEIKIKIKQGRGASPEFLILLDDAYKATGKEKKSIGKGASSEHELYQVFTADHFLNYNPKIEKIVGEKSIDVSLEAYERFICFEIQVSPFNIKENIEKDIFMAKADFVIIVSNDKTIQSKANALIKDLPEEIQKRTQNYLLSEILTQDPDELITKILN
jgi:chromosome segregation and condensation protein ScpB